MSETVFVLGAGASAHAGAPLMFDFLDRAEWVHRIGRSGHHACSFNAVFSALAELDGVFAKGQLDKQNLESVYAAFEMGSVIGRVGSLVDGSVSTLGDCMRDVIVRTLCDVMRFQLNGSIIGAPSAYADFAHYLKSPEVRERLGRVSILTFNYDLGMDVALDRASIPYHYALDSASPAESIALLKLHGSLNWYTLPDRSEGVQWWSIAHLLSDGLRLEDTFGADGVRFMAPVRFQEETPGARIFLVPPTWTKAQHYPRIAPVWREAANRLRRAENVIVFGYSLPPSDAFFSYLFALGAAGDARMKHFWVIDRQPGGQGVESRFRSMLGPTVLPRFSYTSAEFRGLSTRGPDNVRLRERIVDEFPAL